MISFVTIKVLLSLMDGKLHSASALSHENEVSTKTIQRAVEILMQAGITIETKMGKFGGYYMPSISIPQLLNVSNENLSNSFLEESIIASAPKNKLKNILEMSSKIIISSSPWGSNNIDNSKFDLIYDACISSTAFTFDYTNYKNKSSNRTIHPYSMLLKSGSWYVYGSDENQEKFKLFKLNRMSNIHITNIRFKRKDITIDENTFSKFNSLEEKEITVKIKNHSIEELKEWLTLEKEYFSADKNTDYTIAKAKIYETDNFYLKLIEESKNITLLSPTCMVEKLLSYCDKIQKQYSSI